MGSYSRKTADPRLLKGLDWITTEVGSRVYYGTQNRLELPADVQIAGGVAPVDYVPMSDSAPAPEGRRSA